MKYLLILLFLFSTQIFSKEECTNSPLEQTLEKYDDPIWNNCTGTFHMMHGDTYEGEWRNKLQEGYGTYSYVSGEKYVGNWKNGKKHGKGTFYYSDGQVLKGEWCKDNFIKGNKYDAEGVFITDEVEINGLLYKGDFNENCHLSGKGEAKLKNGNSYKGEFKYNVLHGKGVFSWNDGRVWVGEWRKDKWIGGKKYAAGEYQSNDTLIDEAKATCKEIGFQEKTEKFGECVVELYKGMAKSQLTTNTNTSTNKELLEIEKRRLAIEEDKASRDKWGNIGKVLRDLSKSPNNNTPNNNSNSSACYSECRTSNPNATIRYCKSICRY
tara:strand:+ start:2361 stop:3332 length:972 start_codon:yes stop_codon:yes gene_type:complete